MELTLRKVRTAAITLAGMDSKTYPAKMSYAFGVNRELFEREIRHVEEQRIKLCEQHAKKDEDGKAAIKDGTYDMTAEENEACSREYNELLDSVVELPVRTVPLEMAERCEAVSKYDVLTAGELHALSFMFTE